MLTAQNLKGNWATVLLPINADDSIDYARLGDEIDYLLRARQDGMYSNGTAGEFHNQLEDEFDRVQELMAEKCHSAKLLFQIGAAHPSPVISLERVKRTVALRPAAFQVILPDWVIARAEEQVYFLQRIAEAAGDIPLVLYHPPHAKTLLLPPDFLRLKKSVKQLIGLKTASGDARWFEDMRLYAKELSVFVPGHLLASGVQEKLASGAYSNVACLSPRGAQLWWQLMQTDLEEALKIQDRILQFFDRCIVPYKNAGYCNPALDKFLAAIGGWAAIGTRLRWPYKWIDERDVAPARTIAKQLLPDFFTKGQ